MVYDRRRVCNPLSIGSAIRGSRRVSDSIKKIVILSEAELVSAESKDL